MSSRRLRPRLTSGGSSRSSPRAPAALAAGDASRASERLREALDLWRGQPLADLDSAGFVQLERARLEELRLSAVEERLDADLALGRQAELVAELHALAREHPLRERLRAQLMLALYRSGRQAEALDVYQQGRRLLAEELGLEPGEALKRLEHAILEQDPALGAPARAAPRRAPPARKRRPPVALLSGHSRSSFSRDRRRPRRRSDAGRRERSACETGLARRHRHAHEPPRLRTCRSTACRWRSRQCSKGVYVAREREGIVWRIDPVTRRVVRQDRRLRGRPRSRARVRLGLARGRHRRDGHTYRRSAARLADDLPQAGGRGRTGLLDHDRAGRGVGHARRCPV